MPAIELIAGTKNSCPGTRMVRSYIRTNHHPVRGHGPHPQQTSYYRLI